MTDCRLFFAIFAFVSGILFYFALPFTPVLHYPIFISILSALCLTKRAIILSWPCLIILFIFGFFYTAVRADLIDTKVLARSKSNVEISGVVEGIDYAHANQRAFIRLDDAGLMRVSFPKEIKCMEGATISLRAKQTYAPNTIDVFNNFDYKRWSFFNGISGTGSADFAECIGGVQSIRSKVHFKANNVLADSLVLGYKNAIPKNEFDVIKTTGAAHIFSISGMHLTMVGGWLFLVFVSLIKLFPFFVRRWPARNMAMPAVAAGLGFYIVLSGLGVATIRSFIMAIVGFLALVLNRKVLSIRSAAIVFVLMILANPFFLVSAGFQLSFAAIFGLLYYFENRRFKVGGIKKFFLVLLMTDVVATLWTAPFLIYHFGTFPIYTILGNLALLPIFTFGIMPFVFIGIITSILGWRGPFIVSDWLYKIVLQFSEWLSGFPYATTNMPEIPGWCLYLVFVGLFLFIIKRHRFALCLFAIAIIWIAVRPVPLLRTTNDGEVVGLAKNGRTYFNVGYSANNPFVIPKYAKGRGNKYRADCKKGFCEYKTRHWTAVSIQKFVPLYNNIGKLCEYDFIISYLPIIIPGCQHKVLNGSVRIYSRGTVENVVPREYK